MNHSPECRWHRESAPDSGAAAGGGVIAGAGTPLLTITPGQVEDGGAYVCRTVDVDCSAAVSNIALVLIRCPTDFINSSRVRAQDVLDSLAVCFAGCRRTAA